MADTGRDRVLSETAIRTATGARGEPQEMTRMRIAQVAPLYESVPPRLYGGTERVVSFLTEELVRFGHEVTDWLWTETSASAGCAPRTPDNARSEEPRV